VAACASARSACRRASTRPGRQPRAAPVRSIHLQALLHGVALVPGERVESAEPVRPLRRQRIDALHRHARGVVACQRPCTRKARRSWRQGLPLWAPEQKTLMVVDIVFPGWNLDDLRAAVGTALKSTPFVADIHPADSGIRRARRCTCRCARRWGRCRASVRTARRRGRGRPAWMRFLRLARHRTARCRRSRPVPPARGSNGADMASFLVAAERTARPHKLQDVRADRM